MRISNTFNDRVIEIGSHFNVYMELNSSNVLRVKENIDINLLKCAMTPLNQRMQEVLFKNMSIYLTDKFRDDLIDFWTNNLCFECNKELSNGFIYPHTNNNICISCAKHMLENTDQIILPKSLY
jgi:hypothetical protein